MQLVSVRVENIRSYRSAELTLGPGTTLLTGDVGSGKTSLLYAIEMALFGFAEVDATYLVRHRARGAEVRLALHDDAHRYELGRRFQRRTRRGRDIFELEENSYSVDGAKSLYSATEVRQRAIDLLGFPDNPNPRAHSDLWRWAVYVPQEQMRAILEADPEDRLQTVRKALGLEQYRTAADNALLVVTELRRSAERSRAEARGLEHFETAATELAGEIAARSDAAARRASERDVARGEVDRCQAAVEATEEARRALERDTAELSQLAERRGAAEQSLRRRQERLREVTRETARWAAERDAAEPRARALAELRHGAEDAERAVAALRAERDSREGAAADFAAADSARRAAREARATVDTDLAHAETERQRAEEELTRRRSEGPTREPPAPTPRTLGEIDAEISAARAPLDAAVADAARLAHVRAETEELLRAGICPRCRQAVRPETFAGHLAEATSELARAEERRTAAQDGLRRLDEERRSRERYERAKARFDELERARASAQEALRTATERTDRLAARRREVERDAQDAEARAAAARPAAEALAALRGRLAAAEAGLAGFQRRTLEATTSLEAARAAEESLRRSEAEAARVQREAQEEAAALAELEGRRAEVEGRVRAGREAPARRAEAERRLTAARSAHERAGLEAARELAFLETARVRAAESRLRVEERRRRVAEADELESLGRWIAGPFRDGVLLLEHRLLARAQGEFDRHFARYFASLVEDPALSARSDAQFSPSVEIDGELTPPEALSGGERTALALAFRLALGSVVRGAGRLRLDTLILDEPTDGFSPEQVVRMGELLEGLGIPQILLVSHEAQLAAVADRVVRVRKESGASTLTSEGPPPEAPTPLAAPPRRVRSPRLDAAEPRPPPA